MKKTKTQGTFPRHLSTLLLALPIIASSLFAEVKLPKIFGDHMVLQRDQKNRVWGWAQPGEPVTVAIGRQHHSTVADQQGNWKVALDPLHVGAPLELKIEGSNKVTFRDVLVGEVWLCSGQSNMQFPVSAANDPDLEIMTARFPRIRLISVPQVGTQEPQTDFEGEWQVCSPETVADFSAVGYFFGRQLHQTLDIPVGLIDNSWGGSAAEAWVRHDLLEADPRYEALLRRWSETARTYNHEAARAKYQQDLVNWEEKAKAARARGEEPPRRPRQPGNPLTGQHRPSNLYNGVLNPIIGFGLRGVIWYQGESNASRAYQYRHLFPLMIRNWREAWGQGEFPFYWVQLADFRDEAKQPVESDWAELREAQTMTLSQLPNTGQAVIIDLGEAHDIHPKNKLDVARRLARIALARDYGLEIAFQGPTYRTMTKQDGKIALVFDHAGEGLDTFDVRDPIGFSIAGSDRHFVRAKAKIIAKDRIEVWSPEVSSPVAVRYAWADNPVCNLQNREGLKAVPFRTDSWPGITAGVDK